MADDFIDPELRKLAAAFPDIAKSLGIGAAQGALEVVGVPGDIRENATSAANYFGVPESVQNVVGQAVRSHPALWMFGHGPTSRQAQSGVEQYTGPFYEPQTPLGAGAEKLGRRAVTLAALAATPGVNAMRSATSANVSQIRAALARTLGKSQ